MDETLSAFWLTAAFQGDDLFINLDASMKNIFIHVEFFG